MTEEAKDESESGGDAIAEIAGYDKWPEDVAIAFNRALGVASLKCIRTNFASAVSDAQVIETEFLVRIGDNQENAQQVRRHIAAFLLNAARDRNEPFETCQRYWNDLLQLGFYRIERRCDLSWFFVDYCREHGQTDIGISVLDPLIAELERLRAEPSVTKFAAEYYEEQLVSMRKLRGKLEAERVASTGAATPDPPR